VTDSSMTDLVTMMIRFRTLAMDSVTATLAQVDVSVTNLPCYPHSLTTADGSHRR